MSEILRLLRLFTANIFPMFGTFRVFCVFRGEKFSKVWNPANGEVSFLSGFFQALENKVAP